MKKYHVNSLGKVEECKAFKRACKFENFDSVSQAEASLKPADDSFFKGAKASREKVNALKLSEILDIELLKDMLAKEYVYANEHPDDPGLKLLVYSRTVQTEGIWNPVTKAARGLIIRSEKEDYSDAVILQRPYEKFFTLSHHESGWSLGDEENETSAEDAFATIDFDAPAEVYDKVDGSLGVLYMAPDGIPALATKGSFESDVAIEYTKFLRENKELLNASKDLLKQNKDTTFAFELTGLNNRIVVEYDKQDIILLGGINKNSGESIAPESFKDIWTDNFTQTERMPAKTLREALELPDRENREGLVVTIHPTSGSKEMKIKIKQDDYLNLHHIVMNFSKKRARNVIFETPATYGELFKLAEDKDVTIFNNIKKEIVIEGFGKAGSDFEAGRRETFNEIVIPRAEKLLTAKKVIDELHPSLFNGSDAKRNFAKTVNSLSGDTTLLFKFFDMRLKGIDPAAVDAQIEMRKSVSDAKD